MVYEGVLRNRHGGPVWYPENHIPVTIDRDILGISMVFFILFVSVVLLFFTHKWRKQEWKSFVGYAEVLFILSVGASILFSQFGTEWERGVIKTHTPYTNAGLGKQVYAEIGLFLTLRGMNVTLKGLPERQLNETINYNERFSWEWEQGRFGYTSSSGEISRQFRERQYRGVPLPIQWIAEYFTLDGERIVWGRYYRQGGFWAHLFLWAAFIVYFVAIGLWLSYVPWGAYALISVGGLMLCGNLLWWSVSRQSETPLIIPFRDDVLRLEYGWSFILCMTYGWLCIVVGGVVILLYPRLARYMETAAKDRYVFGHWANPESAPISTELKEMPRPNH
jgi:dual oxidase maturation factor 1